MIPQELVGEPCQNTPSCQMAFRVMGVEISSTESFRSVRGFLTKSAALAWILEQQVHDAAEVDKRVSE